MCERKIEDVLRRAEKMYRGVEVMRDCGFPSGELPAEWRNFPGVRAIEGAGVPAACDIPGHFRHVSEILVYLGSRR